MAFHLRKEAGSAISSKWSVQKSLSLLAFWVIMMGIMSIASTVNYLLFHSLVEVIIVIFAASAFIVTWSARRLLDNNYLLIAGVDLIFVGAIEVLHLLTYKGTNLVPGSGSNLPTQLWLASRYMLVAMLLTAPLAIKRRVNATAVLLAFLAATVLILLSIYLGVFPTAYIEGSGLTPFKVYSEYLISALLVVSAYLLYLRRASFERKIFFLLSGFILMNIGAELFFTSYVGVYDFANLMGHLFALTAFFLMFLGLVEECYADPVKALFGNLEQSEQKFRAVFDEAGDGILIWRRDLRIVDANREVLKRLGYRREELTGMKLDDILQPKDPSLLPQLMEVFSQSEPKALELLWTTKQGSKVALDVRSSMIKISGEEAALSIARDITEQKKAEQVIKESEERFRSLIENAPMAIAISRDERLLYANPRYIKLFGYQSMDELVGRHCIELVAPQSRETAQALAREHADEQSGEYELEAAGLRRDGSQFPYHAAIAWVHLVDGPASVRFITDITERRAAEELLKRSAADLKQSNEELERFAYVASHDLREPLRMVVSYLGLLEQRFKKDLSKDAQTYIDFAADGGRRMQQMIDDLLAYSRVSNQVRTRVPVEMDRALALSLLNLDALVKESEADITHGPLPRVVADETQMVQLFQNLVDNAIKYRSALAPVIHISAQRNGDRWEFTVQDNGIGIAPEHHEKVFNMFERLQNRQRYPGTGIGLAIAKKIVERHGGRIWVESEEGKGSTFFFTLADVPGDS